MDVRLRRHCIDTLADDAEGGAFGNGVASGDARRAELEQRHRVPIRRLDRDRAATAWHEAREGDDTGSGCADGVADGAGDVDAAVLARSVGVRPDREGPQHGTVDGPDPAGGSRSGCQARDRDDRDGGDSPHRTPPSWEEGNCVPR